MTAKTANQPVELITGPQRAWAGLLEGALQTCGMTVYAARRLEQLADLASLGDVALHMEIARK